MFKCLCKFCDLKLKKIYLDERYVVTINTCKNRMVLLNIYFLLCSIFLTKLLYYLFPDISFLQNWEIINGWDHLCWLLGPQYSTQQNDCYTSCFHLLIQKKNVFSTYYLTNNMLALEIKYSTRQTNPLHLQVLYLSGNNKPANKYLNYPVYS